MSDQPKTETVTPYRERQFTHESARTQDSAASAGIFYAMFVICMLISVYLRLFA